MFRRYACWLLVCCTWPAASAAEETVHPPSVVQPKVDGHWGEEAVGFRWVEEDSRDARWNETDIGPFLASALPTPTGMVNKALSIRVGDAQQASVCFDVQNLHLRCAWTSGFLRFDPARFGIIRPPAVDGKPSFSAPAGPGWMNPNRKYHGLYLHGPRVVLSYSVDGVKVLESPWAESHGDATWLTRTWHIDPADEPLTVVVGNTGTPVLLQGDRSVAGLIEANGAPVQLTIRPHRDAIQIKLLIPLTTDAELGRRLAREFTPTEAVEDIRSLAKPGPARWGDPLVTRGKLAADSAPYVVDTIALPFDNPYRAMMFVGGHDFFSTPGKAAICTLHGDVWLVDGIDDDLDRIEWRRFATGLFQPLGLRIVDDTLYVLGRDQITRLHDRNGDGEADFYECFNNDADTSPGGHDYSGCLETDADGNFYYVSHRGVHRIASDGTTYQTIATGLRNPIGLGIGPDGTITAAPQEGEWTPASALFEVTDGGYFGFGGPRPNRERPLGYDPPICWIPRLVDNSTGGQVWVTSDRWGPLAGHLLNLSFGQCRVLMTLTEPRECELPAAWPLLGNDRHVQVPTNAFPQSARFLQGGSVVLPLSFDSGIMRGRFNPHDAQLYLSGLRGWASAAVKDGCFQRVRYTGQSPRMPCGVRTLRNGIALTFTTPLDPDTAEDPDSYFVEQWNYRYSAAYGSADYRVSNSDEPGHDEVEVLSATLIDPRTVFLEFADVRPVMQMSIMYDVRADDGTPMRDVYYHTINIVPEVRMDPQRLTRRASTDAAARRIEKRLQPGVLWRLSRPAADGDSHDARRSRMAAIHVPAGEPVSPFLGPAPFQATAEMYVRVPLRGAYAFSFEGRGEARLRVNHQEVFAAKGDSLREFGRRTVPLKKGYNRVELFYASPSDGDAGLRLIWSGDDFATEAVPPTVLFHDAADEQLVAQSRLREGRELFASLRCQRCHALPEVETVEHPGMFELGLDAPDLRDAGRRLQAAWIAQWLADPASVRNQTTMPHFFGDDDAGRQQAADVAAYLMTLRQGKGTTPDSESQATFERQVADGRAEALFEDLGCIVCHRLTPPNESDEFDRLSLAFVGRKFRPGELREYLQKPHTHYRASRMPDFRLSHAEATLLAAWLAERGSLPLAEWTAEITGDASRGREWFVQRQCHACHQAGEVNSTVDSAVAAPPFSVLRDAVSARGCVAIAASDGYRGPRFDLSSGQVESLRKFLEAGADSLGRDSDAEAAGRIIERLSCVRCHDRDSQRAVGPSIVAEEGSGQVTAPLPNLTWAGEKLRTDWTARLLAGGIKRPMRPWLAARMPSFPSYCEVLAAGLAHQHGLPASEPIATAHQAPLAEIGRQLTLQTGLDCRQCHGIGPIEPRGDDRTRIALGINFADVCERMRPDYYHRFVLDPPRFDIGSKMPKLAPDGRTTKITNLLDGDAVKQFDAIWHYIQQLDKHPDPRRDAPGNE